MNKLLKVSEVADKLGVNQLTVRRMIDRGELPYVQVGRSMRIDPEELQEMVNSWKTVKPKE